MANNKNFVVKNGLTVGSTQVIDSSTNATLGTVSGTSATFGTGLFSTSITTPYIYSSGTVPLVIQSGVSDGVLNSALTVNAGNNITLGRIFSAMVQTTDRFYIKGNGDGYLLGNFGVGVAPTGLGKVEIKPASNVPQLVLTQDNATIGYSLHVDSTDGTLKFIRNSVKLMQLSNPGDLWTSGSVTATNVTASVHQVQAGGYIDFTNSTTINRVVADGHLRLTSQNSFTEVSGALGVGTATSSSYKLNVSGDINFTGNMYQNGSPFVQGVTSFNTRTGSVTLTSADVVSALGYNPGGTSTIVSGAFTASAGGSGHLVSFISGGLEKAYVDGNGGFSGSSFTVGAATLQNGVNIYQLNTSAHFSTTGLFAVGTTPTNGRAVNILVPDTTSTGTCIDTPASYVGKLVSFNNNAIEKFKVDYAGNTWVSGALTIVTGSSLKIGTATLTNGPGGTSFYVQSPMIFTGGNSLLVSGWINGNTYVSYDGASPITIRGDVTSSGGAAIVLNTLNALSGASDRIVSFKNASTEKAYIDVSGNIFSPRIMFGTGSNECLYRFASNLLFSPSTLEAQTITSAGGVFYADSTAAYLVGQLADNGLGPTGIILNAQVALTSSGAKILSIRNGSTEKSFFDKDGHLTLAAGAGYLSASCWYPSRMSNNRMGISWWNVGDYQWSSYMALGGQTGQGPNGLLTASIGPTVTGYALRDYADSSVAGRGFIWEAGSTGTPKTIAELNSSTANLWVSGAYTSTPTVNLKSLDTDIASAVGTTIDTTSQLTNSGARLLSVRNSGSEKFKVNYDGSTSASGSMYTSGSVLVGSPLQGFGNTATNQKMRFSGSHIQFINSAGNPVVSITDEGTVGIGVGAYEPQSLLSVISSSAVPLTMSNVIADFTHNANNYIQMNVRNANNGALASSDIVATRDDGTDSTGYINMGIGSSNYADPTYSIHGAGDGYLQIHGSNLNLGTMTGHSIRFFTSASVTGYERMRISPDGWVTASVGISSSIIRAQTLTVNGGTVWSSTNQGAGSGLDADTLDGVHGSKFIRNDIPIQVYNPGRLNAFTDSLYTNRLLGRGSVITTTVNGTASVNWRAFYDGNFDQNVCTVTSGTSAVILADFKSGTLTTTDGFTYNDGYFNISFYHGYAPQTVTLRTRDRSDVWTSRGALTNMNSSSVGWSTWISPFINGNYITAAEFTVNAQAGTNAWISEIEYLGTRIGLSEGALITTAGGNIYGSLNTYGTITNAGTINTSGQINSTYGDQAIVSQHDGNNASWYGRILHKNPTANRAVFLGSYNGKAGVFAHNNALSAWSDLYVNTLGATGGGTVLLPSETYMFNAAGTVSSSIWNKGVLSASTYTPLAIGTAASGVMTASFALADHIHAHGAQVIGDGTNHAVATTTYSGFMSNTDKSKLDGIAAGANLYVLPTATNAVLGGVTVNGQTVSINTGTLYLSSGNVTAALGYTPVSGTNSSTVVSLTASAGFSGSLAGTASYATNAGNSTNLNSQAASYYTDIPSRLGYTPGYRLNSWVSLDPQYTPTSQFYSATGMSVTGPTSSLPVGRYCYTSSPSQTNYLLSPWIAIDRNENYRCSIWVKSTTGAATNYITVALLDQSGTLISRDGTFWWYAVTNQPFPTTWTEYVFTAGPDGEQVFPSNAAYLSFGASHINNNLTADVISICGLQVAEQDGWVAGSSSVVYATGSVGVGINSANISASFHMKSKIADGATAVAMIIDTSASWSDTSAKLLSIRNSGSEKVSIDYAGNIISPTWGGNAIWLTGSSPRINVSVSVAPVTIQAGTNATTLLNVNDGVENNYFKFSNSGQLQISGTAYPAIYATGSTLALSGGVSDSTSWNGAVAIDTVNNLTTGKLLAVRNKGTDKAYIGFDGKIVTYDSVYVGLGANAVIIGGGTSQVISDTIQSNNGVSLTLRGRPDDVSVTASTVIDSVLAMTGTNAKILSLKNNGVEKAFVDKNGTIRVVGGSNPAIYFSSASNAPGMYWDGVVLRLCDASAYPGGMYAGTTTTQLRAGDTKTIQLTGLAADGATATASVITSNAAYSTVGAKLLSIQNAGTEKAYVDKDGGISGSWVGAPIPSGSVSAISSGSYSLVMNTASHGVSFYSGTSEVVWITTGGGFNAATMSAATNISTRAIYGYGQSVSLNGQDADGATAIGVIANAQNALTISGAKLLSVRNNGTEKAFVDAFGTAMFGTSASGSAGTIIDNNGAMANSGAIWFSRDFASRSASNYNIVGNHSATILNAGDATNGVIGMRFNNSERMNLNSSGVLKIIGNDAEFHFGQPAYDNTIKLTIGHTRRANYSDIWIGRNVHGEYGTDNYLTMGTQAFGYQGMEFKLGGDTYFYGENVSTTASQSINPSYRMVISAQSDSASAYGFLMNSKAYTTSGAKIVSFRNNNSEKALIDKDGWLAIGTGGTARQAITLGTTTPSASSTPMSIDMGALISSATGSYLKIKMYSDGVAANTFGFGVTSGQMEYVVPSGQAGGHVFYTGADKMRLNPTGLAIGTGITPRSNTDLTIGTLVGTSTATPNCIDLGATYSNTVATNLKFKLYNDGTYYSGFGASANATDYVVPAGASHVFYNGTTEKVRFSSTAVAVTGNLNVSGTFTALAKSFLIDHPTKPGKKLRHGSLEGPEHGVYVRGKLVGTDTIELPEYWTNLVDEDSITVQLTPVGYPHQLYVAAVSGSRVTVGGARPDLITCYYLVQAERKDVPQITLEE